VWENLTNPLRPARCRAHRRWPFIEPSLESQSSWKGRPPLTLVLVQASGSAGNRVSSTEASVESSVSQAVSPVRGSRNDVVAEARMKLPQRTVAHPLYRSSPSLSSSSSSYSPASRSSSWTVPLSSRFHFEGLRLRDLRPR